METAGTAFEQKHAEKPQSFGRPYDPKPVEDLGLMKVPATAPQQARNVGRA